MTEAWHDAGVSRRRVLACLTAAGVLAASAPRTAVAQALAGDRAAGLPAAWTSAETIRLWRRSPPAGGFVSRPSPAALPARLIRNIATPALKVFRPTMPNGRALLVIPGGGYAVVSVLNEGLEVAGRMTQAGYTVFVLVYRLPGEGWQGRAEVPLQDAQRAMRLVRSSAGRHNFDPRNVAVLGFSAGGHLAASLATGYAEPVYAARDTVDRLDAQPIAAGLIYPVIAMDGPHVHKGSRDMLLGAAPDAALLARRSPARHVTADTPPVFLVHTLDDRTVPMENSLRMLEAMKAAGRPSEAHFFASGGHGFGLGEPGTQSGTWVGLFAAWLDDTIGSAQSPS